MVTRVSVTSDQINHCEKNSKLLLEGPVTAPHPVPAIAYDKSESFAPTFSP